MDEKTQEQIEAWDAYVAARDAAFESNSIDDAVMAGHAWRAFLTLFVPAAYQPTATVIPFMRGGGHGADQKH
jgi:hypothetical protein